MRILLASDSFDPAVGGVQRVVRDLGDGLVAAGHEVRVLAPWGEGLAESETLDGLLVERVRLGRPALRPRAIAGFARRVGAGRQQVDVLLADFRPDVVHFHFLQSPLAYLLPGACASHGVPLIATAHGRDVVGEMVEDDALGRRVVRAVLDAAAAVTAPSEATLASARELAPTPLRADFEAVPNALPADMERELAREPATDSRRSGVVAVGELHPKKGFDVLIRAVAGIPGLHLKIAGRGAQRGELTELVAELGVSDRVALLGFVARDALVDLLRSAAVQAVPSRREPFGLVILEGMACGTPVVASRTDGIPEVVADAAVLVPPDDVAALEAALREILEDDDRRRALAAAGRERARLHTVVRTTELYLDVYRRAITTKGRSE